MVLVFLESLTLKSNQLNEISEATLQMLISKAPQSLLTDMGEEGMGIMTDIAIHRMGLHDDE